MRISDWSSDVCSSDLFDAAGAHDADAAIILGEEGEAFAGKLASEIVERRYAFHGVDVAYDDRGGAGRTGKGHSGGCRQQNLLEHVFFSLGKVNWRSEEHTSELQSLMRNSYAVFCLKKKHTMNNYTSNHQSS